MVMDATVCVKLNVIAVTHSMAFDSILSHTQLALRLWLPRRVLFHGEFCS